MRFYLKLFLMVGSFMGLVSATGRRMTGNLAYEARVAFVFTFGSKADRERLIEDTGRMRAVEGGYLEEYLSRERFLQERTRYAQGSDPNDPDTATPEKDSIDEVGGCRMNSTTLESLGMACLESRKNGSLPFLQASSAAPPHKGRVGYAKRSAWVAINGRYRARTCDLQRVMLAR